MQLALARGMMAAFGHASRLGCLDFGEEALREWRSRPQVREAPRERERRDHVCEGQDLLEEPEATDEVRLEEQLE